MRKVRRGPSTPLASCMTFWLLIPWPVHSPHLDAWILLPPGGDFHYGTLSLEVSLKPHLAAAAKLLQSCLTLWNLIDGSPLGSSVPGILQTRTLEWIAISFSNAWK